MKITAVCTSVALVGAAALTGAEISPDISAARILARTGILASDAFEGRAPGTAGEAKTVAYLIAEFQKMGLAPGNPDGTYLQAVPMTGIVSRTDTVFTVGGKSIRPAAIREIVAPSPRFTGHVEVKDSSVVFVGYGVTAPEFGWDDFKGLDVRGKTLIMLINDPPVPDPANPSRLDPKVFGGSAMSYFGRWTYKYESAAARGAAACLIVHETGPAAYPFSVVVDSRSRENFELPSPDGNAGRAAVEGWLTLDATKELLAAAGLDFDRLKAAITPSARSLRKMSSPGCRARTRSWRVNTWSIPRTGITSVAIRASRATRFSAAPSTMAPVWPSCLNSPRPSPSSRPDSAPGAAFFSWPPPPRRRVCSEPAITWSIRFTRSPGPWPTSIWMA